jgi:hypothetical protein
VRPDRPLTGAEGEILVRIAHTNHAWPWPKETRKATVTLVVVIIVAVVAAGFAGHGAAVAGVIALAALTVAVEELLRAALKYWLRVA